MNSTQTPPITPNRVVYVENRIRAAHARAQGNKREAEHLRVVPDPEDLWLGWALQPADGTQPGDIPIPDALVNGDVEAITRRLERQGWLRIEGPGGIVP